MESWNFSWEIQVVKLAQAHAKNNARKITKWEIKKKKIKEDGNLFRFFALFQNYSSVLRQIYYINARKT